MLLNEVIRSGSIARYFFFSISFFHPCRNAKLTAFRRRTFQKSKAMKALNTKVNMHIINAVEGLDIFGAE